MNETFHCSHQYHGQVLDCISFLWNQNVILRSQCNTSCHNSKLSIINNFMQSFVMAETMFITNWICIVSHFLKWVFNPNLQLLKAKFLFVSLFFVDHLFFNSHSIELCNAPNLWGAHSTNVFSSWQCHELHYNLWSLFHISSFEFSCFENLFHLS